MVLAELSPRLPTRAAVEREWTAQLRASATEIDHLRAELDDAREAQAHLLASAHAHAGLSLRRLGAAIGVSATEVRRRIDDVGPTEF